MRTTTPIKQFYFKGQIRGQHHHHNTSTIEFAQRIGSKTVLLNAWDLSDVALVFEAVAKQTQAFYLKI